MSGGGDWTLCIDFGTAFSKAAAAPMEAWSRFNPEWLRPLMLANEDEGRNAFLLESAVFVDEERVLFGAEAAARGQVLARNRRALRSFKTLLSVSDLDRALNTSAPAAVDPRRLFTMRDLVTLYLAYFLAAIERAISLDPELSGDAIGERRYAAPAWRGGDSAGQHGAVVALFAEAEAVLEHLGERLLEPGGLALSDVEDALQAKPGAARAGDMGLIFEATAAAAYTSIGHERSTAHVVVVDIGAGTTDITALFRAGARMRELRQARVTLKQAGDFLDHVIANLAISASAARSPEERGELWNLLKRQMVEIKDSVFQDGRAILRHRNRTHVITLAGLERDKDYREFKKDIAHAYAHSVDVARRHALQEGRRELQTVAVGGGAVTPFIKDMLASTSTRGLRLTPSPAVPVWARTVYDGNLGPVFPQLAIAIGGALAPPDMLAARGGD